MARLLRALAILSILTLAIIPFVVSADTWTYNTTGTHNWTAPANVTKIRLFMVGGGGAGHPGNYIYGGNGGTPGSVVNLSFLSVTSGTYYPLTVGTGGANKSGTTGYTDIGSNSGTLTYGFGYNAGGGAGGTYKTSGGYGTDGGTGYRTSTKYTEDGASNGGVAGGIGGIGFGAGGGGGALTWDGVGTGLGGYGAQGHIEITSLNITEGNWPDFSASPTSGSGGTLIKFTNLSTIHETTNLTFLWDFGDGGTSNTTGDVNHVYSYTGIYTVSLTISSDDGTATETKKDYIAITSVNYYDPNNPPKSVRFHIQTLWGMPLPGATVSALGITTSTGSWDWVVTLLGIPLDEVGINGTAMTDTTDSNGNIEFLMIPSAKYNVTTTLSGYSFPIFYVTPHDTQYNIIAALNGTGWFETGNDTLAQIKINVTSEKISDTVGRINISYYDAGGTTVSGAINITKDNTTRGGEPVLVESIPMTGSSGNYTTVVDIPQEGTAYKVSVNPNPYGTAGPDIIAIRDFAVWFKGEPIALAGFSPTILLWFSIFLLIFTAMFAGATHAPQMAIILCVEAWVLFSMGWLDPLETNYWVGQPVLVFTLGFATVMAIWWNLGEGKRKETGR